MKKTLLFPILFVLLFATPALAVTNVTSCQIISASDTYVLQSDINATSFTNGACFYVDGAYDVVFEGNGFNIDCQGCSTEVAFRKPSQPFPNSLTINNLSTSNFDYSLDYINDYINIHDSNLNKILVRPQVKLNITNTVIDESNRAVLIESFGSEEVYISDSEFYCSNVQSGNACMYIEGYGTMLTLSIQDSIINNQDATNPYGLYYENVTEFAEVLNMYFDNNIVNETSHQSTIKTFSPAGSYSFTGNTWTNPTNTGHSNTCTNDGFGFCVEDYLVLTDSFDEPVIYDSGSIALTEFVPCVENWQCIVYNPAATCDINDTKTAECVGVVDVNACGTTYGGDYSEFPPQVTACDYCTPIFLCDGYDAFGACQTDDTQNASCNSVTDINGCFATTGLPSDQYTGDFSEYLEQSQACDYCTPSWSCDGYESGECPVSEEFACNSATDSNACFAATGLPSDEYTGDYSEFAGEACTYVSPTEQAASGFNRLAVLFLIVGLFGAVVSSVSSNKVLKEKYGWVEMASIALMVVGVLALLL